MVKGYWKFLGATLICGILVQGCVSASSYRKLEERYNSEMITLTQHTKSLEMANAEMDQQSQKANMELEIAKADIEKLKQDSRVDQETMLRLQERIIKKLQFGDIAGVTVEEGKLNIQGDVLFASGEAVLKASAKDLLNKIAEVLKGEPNYYIRIDGHTDSDPIVASATRWTTKSNFELAAYRALSVLLYFEEQGVDPSRLFLCSFGEHRSKSAAKKSENRRVTISFIEINPEKSSTNSNRGDEPSK
ncbi:MAG: OmpA family protein [Planctomycetota bacterium]